MPKPKSKSSPARKKPSRFNQRRVARWALLLLVLFCALYLPPIIERQNLAQVGVNWAPDQQQKIVIYQAPKVFGNGQATSAHIILETKDGQPLKRMRLENLHDLNNITWEENAVLVNETRWPR